MVTEHLTASTPPPFRGCTHLTCLQKWDIKRGKGEKHASVAESAPPHPNRRFTVLPASNSTLTWWCSSITGQTWWQFWSPLHLFSWFWLWCSHLNKKVFVHFLDVNFINLLHSRVKTITHLMSADGRIKLDQANIDFKTKKNQIDGFWPSVFFFLLLKSMNYILWDFFFQVCFYSLYCNTTNC